MEEIKFTFERFAPDFIEVDKILGSGFSRTPTKAIDDKNIIKTTHTCFKRNQKHFETLIENNSYEKNKINSYKKIIKICEKAISTNNISQIIKYFFALLKPIKSNHYWLIDMKKIISVFICSSEENLISFLNIFNSFNIEVFEDWNQLISENCASLFYLCGKYLEFIGDKTGAIKMYANMLRTICHNVFGHFTNKKYRNLRMNPKIFDFLEPKFGIIEELYAKNCNYSEYYLIGKNYLLRKNHLKAKYFFELGQGSKETFRNLYSGMCKFELAKMYLKGIGIEVNKKMAFSILKDSGKDFNIDYFGLPLLGDMYYFGWGCEKCIKNALWCYEPFASRNVCAYEGLYEYLHLTRSQYKRYAELKQKFC